MTMENKKKMMTGKESMANAQQKDEYMIVTGWIFCSQQVVRLSLG